VRLELNSEGRYAMRALVYLAIADERAPAGRIAAETSVPPRLLARILADLSRAGLVVSKAGRDGGAMLARPADAITLRDIVEAVEGPFAVSSCILEGRACDGGNRCTMHDAWTVAQRALLTELERRTLAELVVPAGLRLGAAQAVGPR
jgi:Rrf2 family protein